MSFSDVEHFGLMVDGCESIVQHSATGNGLNPAGQYALSVLKLHAQDAGFVAGQEGFLDNVKKGAASAKEWLIKLIQAIYDYLTDAKGKKKREENLARLKEVERAKASNDAESKRWNDEVVEAYRNALSEVLNRLEHEVKNLEVGPDYLEFKKNYAPVIKTGQFGDLIKRTKTGLSSNDALGVTRTCIDGVNNFSRSLQAVTRQVESVAKRAKPEDEESLKSAGKLLRAYAGIYRLFDMAFSRAMNNAADIKEPTTTVADV